MFFKNARIFCSDFQFRMGGFEVTDEGLFGQIHGLAPFHVCSYCIAENPEMQEKNFLFPVDKPSLK